VDAQPAGLANIARGSSKYAALAVYSGLWLWCVAEYVMLGITSSRTSWVWPWCGVAASLLLLAAGGKRIYLPFLLLSVAGFGVEQMGIHYGVFGQYSYTPTLGVGASGVPLAMGIAWALLLCYVSQMLSPLPLNRLVLAALGAVWMTSIDLLVDPLAAGPLKLWIWHDGGSYFGIPFSNFVGWFCVSFLLLLVLGRFHWSSRAISLIGLSLVVSLALGAMRNQMWILVAISAVLVVAHWVVEQLHPVSKRLLLAPGIARYLSES
jgi:uncharacterized membrane protein